MNRSCALGAMFSVFACATALAQAPAPVAKTPPSLPEPTLFQQGLPPPPDVRDWSPRGRAPFGGIIVITGQGFRPKEFLAVIGPAKFRLPVRLATSTSSRIELDVPTQALGQAGDFVVGHQDTQAVTLEQNYRVDTLLPSLAPLSVGNSVYPFVLTNFTVRVLEFPGARLDPDDVTFRGSCGFVKRSGVVHAPVDRAANLSLSFGIQGWFQGSGSCQLEVVLRPLAPNGSPLSTIQLAGPLSLPAPQLYTFNSTGEITARFQPVLRHFGVGSICEATANPSLGIQASGVTTIGSDMQILTRGGPLDVSCTFKTKEWILPEGVRLKEIHWKSAKVGNRCGLAGSFSQTFPSVSPSLTRGTVVVKPDADQAASSFFTFSDTQLVVDGVTFASNLSGPRTMILPFTLGTQCVSTLTVLVTVQGKFGPTIDPQSYGIVLDKVVFEGPPGLAGELN